MTRDEFEQTCKDVCPNCANSAPLRQRTDTKEWVHDHVKGAGHSHAFCLASHFRNKHKDSIDG